MQDDQNYGTPQNPEQFGMTEEDVKSYKIKSFWGGILYYLSKIEPFVVKMFNTIIYYTIKFIKAFVKTTFSMIMGKE